jgi:large subunit ribosomal protein L15
MESYNLKPKHKSKKRKRVGRGGKRGTYSGRGMKGQKSRAGRKMQPMIRELIKKYPKLRGYRDRRREKKIIGVNIAILDEKFKVGEIINPKVLIEKKIIKRIKGKIPLVKILGRGKIKKKLIIKGCQMSKAAKEKIKQAEKIIKNKD